MAPTLTLTLTLALSGAQKAPRLRTEGAQVAVADAAVDGRVARDELLVRVRVRVRVTARVRARLARVS
eukprot:scaffold7939_cov45-Phaeocystis_antarctica.AAC.1